MNPLEWQADQVVPTRAMRYIGAGRTYAQRVNWFFGIPNTLVLIGLVAYERAAILQQVFPNQWAWFGFVLLVAAPGAMLLDRMVLHPAQIIYNQHQNGVEERSPNYRETMVNQRSIDRLHSRLDAAGIPDVDEADQEASLHR